MKPRSIRNGRESFTTRRAAVVLQVFCVLPLTCLLVLDIESGKLGDFIWYLTRIVEDIEQHCADPPTQAEDLRGSL